MPADDLGATPLTRSLSQLQHAQDSWLDDLTLTSRGDKSFVSAFRRWEEQLTLIKLQIHRIETRLQHYLLTPSNDRPARDLPPITAVDRRLVARSWRERLEPYFTDVHLDTAYRHLDSCLDHDQEAIPADIITDLTTLAEIATATSTALADLQRHQRSQPDFQLTLIEEFAFYRVLSPWKAQGMPALLDVLRWLSETLRLEEDW